WLPPTRRQTGRDQTESPGALSSRSVAWPSLRGELVDGGLRVRLAGLENDRGKLRVMDRIREMLCFQAKALVLAINRTALPLDLPVQEVAGVELNPGLRGQNLQDAPRLGIAHAGGQDRLVAAAAAEHKVVIVAAGIAFQLADALADQRRGGEV